jgi:hypothetical protein
MNYKPVTLLLLAAILCPFVSSCSSDEPTTTDNRPPAIYGRILDSGGNPVANAGVSLHFSYVQGIADTSGSLITLLPHPVTDQLGATYTIPSPGHVTVELLRADTRALVRTLIDAEQQAGEHYIAVGVQGFPNQAYIIRLVTPHYTAERLVIINSPQLPRSTPFLRTDNDGRFTIYYSSLPIGLSFQQVFETGVQGARLAISDSLQLTIVVPGTADRIWSLKVDTTAVVDSTLRLP